MKFDDKGEVPSDRSLVTSLRRSRRHFGIGREAAQARSGEHGREFKGELALRQGPAL